METIKLRDEYIKLGQALKAAGFVESGVEAKLVIQDGLVKVNGQTETQRGKKLYDGDEVQFENYKIIKCINIQHYCIVHIYTYRSFKCILRHWN